MKQLIVLLISTLLYERYPKKVSNVLSLYRKTFEEKCGTIFFKQL